MPSSGRGDPFAEVWLVDVDEEIAELEAEKERRERGEELAEEADRLAGDLRAFTRAAWSILEPATTYRHNWHIDAISEHLEAAYEREIRQLLINVPPRRMKSLTVSVFGPAWRWTHAPHERFLTASYGSDLSIEHSVKTRRLLQSAWFRARFGHMFALTSDQNVKSFYENDRTGYRIATSVGGSGTGRGGDVIVVDDPHDTKRALSDVERQNALTWHDQTLSTRFNDPKTGVEIVIMQRLHQEDLTGHLLEQGGWTHLCLPEEYEPKLVVSLPSGGAIDAACPPTRKAGARSLQGDPRTEAGDPLWPEHVPADALATLKGKLGSFGVAGQLQQRPAPAEGGIFKTADWRFFSPEFLEPPSPLVLQRIVQSWDTAWKEKQTSDYVVGTVWGAAGANRYLLRRVRERMGVGAAKRAIREFFAWVEETYPGLPHTILVENTTNGPDIVAELRDEIPGLVLFNASRHGDKVQRAHAISPIVESHNVFLPGKQLADGSGPDPGPTPGWVMDWIAEHAAFPNAANDDQVDTTSQVLIHLRGVQEIPRPDVADRPERNGEREMVTAGLYESTF